MNTPKPGTKCLGELDRLLDAAFPPDHCDDIPIGWWDARARAQYGAHNYRGNPREASIRHQADDDARQCKSTPGAHPAPATPPAGAGNHR